jgi:hypothetical protein
MKSLQARFNRIKSKNPLTSSLICFNIACIGGNFEKRTVSEWFRKCVDRKDYLPSYKDTLIKQSFELSKE